MLSSEHKRETSSGDKILDLARPSADPGERS